MARLFSIPASLLLRTFYWFPFWCPTETQEGNLDLLRTLCALFTLRQDTDLPSARSFLLVCTPPRMPETAWALCKESFLWVRQQWWKPCLHIDYFVPFNNLIDQTCVCFVCVKGFFCWMPWWVRGRWTTSHPALRWLCSDYFNIPFAICMSPFLQVSLKSGRKLGFSFKELDGVLQMG